MDSANDVIRHLQIDYIYFDLVFLSVFITMLIVRKKIIPLIAWAAGGIIIFIIDWGFWLHVFGIRSLVLPDAFLPALSGELREFLFMFWFSMTYGVMFSWMFLMFEKKSNKPLWTVLLFAGWLAIAFLSQLVPLNDAVITTSRAMGTSRLLQIILVAAGYLTLFLMRYNWKKILFLFGVGCGIHFMMEFTLWVSGIRPSSWDLLLINTLLESNMGVPLLYILYDKLFSRLKKPAPAPVL